MEGSAAGGVAGENVESFDILVIASEGAREVAHIGRTRADLVRHIAQIGGEGAVIPADGKAGDAVVTSVDARHLLRCGVT